MAGIFPFLPLLAKLGFDRLVVEAQYPGSEMVPAPAAVLSLLTLKLLDKERRSHIGDWPSATTSRSVERRDGGTCHRLVFQLIGMWWHLAGDFNFDEALGLFAGLNILPKKSFATDYSYRTVRVQH